MRDANTVASVSCYVDLVRERPTMHTIAAHAGVAPSTVSRALVNHPSIPKETCERIQALASSLGYRPNPLVSALMQARRNPQGLRDQTTVVLLSGYTSAEAQHLPYVRRFADAARSRAESLGYRIEWMHVASEADAQRIDKLLQVRGVQGVLIGLFPGVGISLPMSWDRYAFAAIGLNVAHPIGHRAENDQGQAIDLAMDNVQTRGYSKVGLVMQVNPQVMTEARFRRTFIDRQKMLGVNPIPPLEMPELTRDRFDAWFTRHRPDCILSGHLEVLKWLERKRAKRPIGFVCTDLHLESFADPQAADRVAGVIQNYEAVGAAAFDLVEEALRHNSRGIPEAKKLLTIESMWKDGASLPRVGPKQVTARSRESEPQPLDAAATKG